MRYCATKPEGRGFDSRKGGFEFFSDIIHTMALGSTQPLTEMRTRNGQKLTTLPP